MATNIVLSISIDENNVTPYVMLNPYYSQSGITNPPTYGGSISEGWSTNHIHKRVLKFAEEIKGDLHD